MKTVSKISLFVAFACLGAFQFTHSMDNQGSDNTIFKLSHDGIFRKTYKKDIYDETGTFIKSRFAYKYKKARIALASASTVGIGFASYVYRNELSSLFTSYVMPLFGNFFRK